MYRFSYPDSATIVYHDVESAYLCKKHLGDQYYKGRVLTITIEVKKNYPNSAINNLTISQDEEVARQIATLKPEQRRLLLGMLKKFKGQG